MLTRPYFYLDKPNPNPSQITDAEWWFWLRLKELEPDSELSGIYGDKPGFHNTGDGNDPGNYSIADLVNRTGPWWRTYSSALDWTFRDAQRGIYTTIAHYTSRMMASARDAHDPRLDLILFEFYGQSDIDLQVEGYNEYREEFASSDDSHLWHIHLSFLRSKCGDYWAMWALLTVLMGWTVGRWKTSLLIGGHDVARMAAITKDGNTTWMVGDGIFYTPVMTWPEHEMHIAQGAVEKTYKYTDDWKGWVGRIEASSGANHFTQEQLNQAIGAQVPAIAAELAKHIKIV